MCLYTVTEDNPPSHHLLTSTPSHLAQLETLLTPPPTGLLDQGHMMILSTATAGRSPSSCPVELGALHVLGS